MKFLECKIPPAALFLIFAALIWLISVCVPAFSYNFDGQKWFGIGLFIIGGSIGLIGVMEFRKASTTVDPLTPEKASNLVKSGIYQYSRNPMYLGLLFGLMGWAVYLANPLSVLLLIGFVLYMNRFQIIPEERAMVKNFGDEFVEYKKSVRRWF